MRSKSIRKIIASALMFSLFVGVGVSVTQPPQIVQADDDRDDIYDTDDREVFKGTLSVTGTTTHFGRPAVSLPVPAGIKVKDLDVENEPHDDIDEAVVGGNIVIYGLRTGVTYRNLRLKIEDFNGVDYIYNLNPFTVSGSSQGSANTSNNSGQVTAPTQANRQAIQDYLKKVYQNIFGREVDQQGLDFWTSQLASGQVELDEFFQRLLVEKEFLTVAPTPEEKIKKIYAGVFQREPDQGGLQYWVSKYNEELRDEKNEREALEDIIDKMTEGPEYQSILNKLGLHDD